MQRYADEWNSSVCLLPAADDRICCSCRLQRYIIASNERHSYIGCHVFRPQITFFVTAVGVRSVTRHWKRQTVLAVIRYCRLWLNNELQRRHLLIPINFTSVFCGPCCQRLNDNICGERTKQRLGSHIFASLWCSHQDTALRRCQVVVLVIHQSDMLVSLDLFDVFPWHAGGYHCVRLKPFSRHDGWSLTHCGH